MTDLIPLSVLELDLPTPVIGWSAYLSGRGVAVELDDIGRLSVSRDTARELLTEQQQQREASARKMAEAERRAIEQDERRRASLPRGIPAGQVRVGLTAAEAMVATDPDLARRPRRRSVLEEQLAGGGLVFHPLGPDDEAS
jgi:hypothetical protein